ncbi:MAG: NAD-dependent epimerase/dehydratase family protein [Nitrospirae bacterium]|nr:NAD-dependent epimerase/dehydratase family protein [Nitrospirota bacterium]
MKKSLFITGSSGFISGNFIQKLNLADFEQILCISRKESAVTDSLSKYGNFKFIKGDIFVPELYKEYLPSIDTVVHFAAVTGKAMPEEYFRTNLAATEALLKECVRCGVKNFLFVSSIAVKFPDISRYYYAQSKLKAEELVRKSGLNYSIVRPAIVIGKGSSILESFVKVAKMPLSLIFGNGKTKIQPIYTDDLSECFQHIINEDIFNNEIYELGGPEILTIDEFVTKIAGSYLGRAPKLIHFPLGLLVPVLSVLEKFIYSALPFNVGQLSSFRFDGTISENRVFSDMSLHMKNVDEMLALSAEKKTSADADKLKKECAVFSLYLICRNPDEYVTGKYKDAHIAGVVANDSGLKQFDSFLARAAGFHPILTKLADVYTSVFFKGSVLRKKLVLLLAIIESSAPASFYFDSAPRSARLAVLGRFLRSAIFFTLSLLVSFVIFSPFHLFYKATSGDKNEG